MSTNCCLLNIQLVWQTTTHLTLSRQVFVDLIYTVIKKLIAEACLYVITRIFLTSLEMLKLSGCVYFYKMWLKVFLDLNAFIEGYSLVSSMFI